MATDQELSDKIEKQKMQYESILSSLSEVVWLCWADSSELIYSNAACQTVLGYTADEIMADKGLFFDSIHPDDKARFLASLQEMQATGRTAIDFRFIHKGGSTRYLASTVTLIKGKNAEPDTYTGSAIDITKQKMTEDALLEKALEVENILESITDAFLAADANWNLVYVNRAAEKMYNVKREDILHKNVWSVFPKTMNTKFYESFQRVLKEQVSLSVEGISPTSGRWVSVSAYPSKNGIVAYFKDISEQKMLMEHISNNNHNLNSLIDNTSDLVWSVDRNLKYISINQAFKESAYRLYNIVIKPRGTALPKEMGEEVIEERKAQYHRAFAGENFMVLDKRKSGDILIYRETKFNPITDSNGDIIGASCFSRDITERERHLMTIEAQNEKLKEIAWIQSHKVRGPLATILGLSNIFNTQDAADPNNAKIIKGIKEEAENLDIIIREVVKKTYDI